MSHFSIQIIYDLEEHFTRIHLPNWQFYLPQAIGRWGVSSPAGKDQNVSCKQGSYHAHQCPSFWHFQIIASQDTDCTIQVCFLPFVAIPKSNSGYQNIHKGISAWQIFQSLSKILHHQHYYLFSLQPWWTSQVQSVTSQPEHQKSENVYSMIITIADMELT